MHTVLIMLFYLRKDKFELFQIFISVNGYALYENVPSLFSLCGLRHSFSSRSFILCKTSSTYHLWIFKPHENCSIWELLLPYKISIILICFWFYPSTNCYDYSYFFRYTFSLTIVPCTEYLHYTQNSLRIFFFTWATCEKFH